MKFKYKDYGHGILRPVISIEVKHKEMAVPYEVLVDSGADICIFHASIGEVLGLDVEKGKMREVFGIGGKSSLYYLHNIGIMIGKEKHEIEAGFMPNVAGHILNYGVVGQKGFFDKFIIKFDFLKSEIEINAKN